MSVSAEAAGCPKRRQSIVHKYIQLVGPTGFESPSKELSGACASGGHRPHHAYNPKVSLMDEPSGRWIS